uniref:Ring finger protein 17 n=1 Tax=Echeneis naucrates TaxID=173247 RepID=A0A665V3T4_ECHNA
LPEGGVYSLQEDSRIIGLIYTAKMNKKKSFRKMFCSKEAFWVYFNQPADIEKTERAVDEALVQAAENVAQLEHIHETLKTGLEEQVTKERARLEMEIKQAADKALHTIQKWRDVQLIQLTKLEAQFSTSQAEVSRVQERMKALELAIQMAREVRRVPFLEQYCTLDKVMETLQAPVDKQCFDMKCVTMSSGLSLSESPTKGLFPGSHNRKSWLQSLEGRDCISPSCKKPPSPQKQSSGSPGDSSPSLQPRRRSSGSRHSSGSDLGSPDLIVEEVLEERQEPALPPTGPELANDKWRVHRKKRNQIFGNRRNVTQWVVVTYVVNPSHFYVRYVAEKRESEILSRKINRFCCRDSSCFTSGDTVETGSLIFVKWKEGLWTRAIMVEILQIGCGEAVKTCKVTQLASVRVFLLDYGLTKSLILHSEKVATESSLNTVNQSLRKVGEALNVELGHFAPQAIRCCLKDLVPYDLTKGWSEEARVEFCSVVGSAAVEMRPFGQDRDSLLVDLRKAPMDQSSDVPISVREYLVFIEVAKFYSPVTQSGRPLLYYPPLYPKVNTELNAVVSHINNPADFYIQLVDNMESLLLSAKLQECYSATTMTGQDDLSIYCPVIGQACVACYDDKLWYRAQVVGHPGGRKVEVRFVDFGNKKIVSVSDLRKIKDEFFALPSKAIHCCLSNVIPADGETWSEACTNRFISLAHQKLITIVATGKVPKTEPLPIEIFESSLNGPLSDIAEVLVKEDLACFKDDRKSRQAKPPADDSAIWDPPLDVMSDEELQEFHPQLKLPAQPKDLKVRVCHVNSPSSFYVQLTQNDSQLKRVCELVKKECALMEPGDVTWKVDEYCAAQINGVWERGQICSDVTSSNVVEVMRCDHGNKVKLHTSTLRLLPTSMIGSLALECTLTDIRPAGGRSTWTATACDLFSHYLTGASAVMTFKELTDPAQRPAPVTLFCSNKMGQFVSIADFLVSEGLALRERKQRDAVLQKPTENDSQNPVTDTQTVSSAGEKTSTPLYPFSSQTTVISTSVPPKPAPRSIMSAEKVITPLYLPPELPCLGHFQMNVSAVGDDGLIYIRTQYAECQLEQLRERIQQSMKTLPKQKPYTWKSVQGCAVIGPDMLWYRGQRLELLGGHVKVQYVDYGLVENIPVVHVYPVLLCDDVPQLCMPCQLHGVNPVGGRWQQDAVVLLMEVLLNRCVDVQVVELPADPREPLTVELFLDGLSLSRILCHHEHASMDRTISGHSEMPPAQFLDDWDIDTEGLRGPEEPVLGRFIYPNLPQEGERFQVRVKHLWTPNELFLWPLEGTADVELDEALTRINTNINSLSQLSHFSYGRPCLAKYSDGKYYRAKLMKITSVDPVMILVQHVDFGCVRCRPSC